MICIHRTLNILWCAVFWSWFDVFFATTLWPSFLGWCICPSHAFDSIRTPSNLRQNSLCKSTECTKDQRHRHLGGWICIMRCALAYQRDAFAFSLVQAFVFILLLCGEWSFVAFAQRRSYLSFIKYCALICCCFMLSTRSTPKSLCLFLSS